MRTNFIILEELKYMQILNQDCNQVENSQKYKLISEVMMKMTNFKVRDFPITGSLNTGVCTIEMKL